MTSNSTTDLEAEIVARTYEWLRDCGLDVGDVEPFVKREVMPLLAQDHQRIREALLEQKKLYVTELAWKHAASEEAVPTKAIEAVLGTELALAGSSVRKEDNIGKGELSA